MIEYQILTLTSADTLAIAVSVMLNQGWSLVGAPFLWIDKNEEITWHQAIVRGSAPT